ncbi:hypothetical protein CPB83DRAFT_887439 [Crepidotus variabilis]|uniref:F-box domain-containing protein n=1 Tax=Crepidotus variabilis TaxID=179855 RepID=A0A9P6E4Z2_9AGAR|nr:hypothetical protein CPB83DRAFT_887439 [Crepidotus variabilis]
MYFADERRSLPPELWAEIFGLACSDNGFSGRSISNVCRYFHEVCKPVKYRSVAILGIPSAIKFLLVIQNLPQEHRRVESMYLSLYSPRYNQDEQIQSSNPKYQAISRKIDAVFDAAGIELERSLKGDKYDHRHHRQRVQLAIQILQAVAPSLRLLFLSFAQVPRKKLFLPVHFPCLSELALIGLIDPRVKIDLTGDILPSLRRLRMSYHRKLDPHEIWVLTPNVTHLRLDCEWTPNFVNESALVRYLGPPQTMMDMPLDNSSPFLIRLPQTLQCFIVFLGSRPPFLVSEAIPELQRAQQTLEELFESNEKLFIQRGGHSSSPWSYYREEEVRFRQEWLTRLEGSPAHWDVANH